MQSLKQFFAYMHDVDFIYCVLRNFDGLPYDVQLGEHSDLDLLVYDFKHFTEIFPKSIFEFPYPRVRAKIPIADSYIYCDVRHLGDNYYPEDFEKEILATREWNSRGFYTPDPLRHTLALAYHAVHHKNHISKDYKRYLGDATVEQILDALKQSSIGWVKPDDSTVGSFNGYWKGATSIVEKEDGFVRKRQTSFVNYPLLDNERMILSGLEDNCFPVLKSFDKDSITIEDCGEPLSAENLPEDWKYQLQQIVIKLKNRNLIHRDIRLDNLMVKDGIIKLIDFGWAKYADEEDSKETPSCLGFPNKPSWGHDDSYSMNRVIKQLEFQCESLASSATI